MKEKKCSFLLVQVGAQEKALVQKIFQTLKVLRAEYPDFCRWFNTKVKTGLSDGSRELWIAASHEGKMAGIMILKKSDSEKKICTLYINEHFRRQGLGTLLMLKAFERLETMKPLATVSSSYMLSYQPLFNYFGFELSKIYTNYYREGVDEYSFNGELLSQELKKAVSV